MRSITISVGGSNISLSKTVKFPGVTLDNKLNYNTHNDNVTQKVTAALMECKRSVRPIKGISPKTCKWIYTAVVSRVRPFFKIFGAQPSTCRAR